MDLQPTLLSGFNNSMAIGTDGHRQVGYGLFNGSALHALLWSGTADSAVDLSPTNLAGYTLSLAIAVHANQVVGIGSGPGTGTHDHALLWPRGADSTVDLNPAGFLSSDAVVTNGAQQVGYGGTGSEVHALLWDGSAASVVDLQNLLPPGFTESFAFSFDQAGDVFGIAYDTAGNTHAVEWVVPEPSFLSLVILSMPLMLRRRTRDADSRWDLAILGGR